ncbi:MAG TPA: phosphocholine cytidylyltransferase family protein [Sphingomicrobium sp.]|nr:phosphocholine cytidylyltransferase family protein [Sphingomicrobium sp.]
MKAIILSAGQGSRLLPLTADRPKCLVPVGGQTILEYQLAGLARAGVREVAIVGGYCFDRLVEFAERRPHGDRPGLIYNPFHAVSSSIGSVWAARHLLDGPFCLLNGDTLCEPASLAGALASLAPGVNLLIEPIEEGEHDDMLVRAESGRVLEVRKTLAPSAATHRSIGIVACPDEDGGPYAAALAEVIRAPRGEQRFHHDIVDLLAGRGRVSAVEIEQGAWQEIDSAADIDRWLGASDSAAA